VGKKKNINEVCFAKLVDTISEMDGTVPKLVVRGTKWKKQNLLQNKITVEVVVSMSWEIC